MTPPKKIILISLDTLRADHLGCYGYPRNTSPTLDTLATQGILFRNAFSPSSHTIPAHGSIFTGKYPSKHTIGFNQNILVETGKLNTDIDITLAEVLKNCDLKTAAFISGIVLSKKTNFNAGFEVYDDEIEDDPYGRRNCFNTNQRVKDWLADNFSQNFFIFIHYFDIHGPYHCQNKYQELFLNDSNYKKSPLPHKYSGPNPERNTIPEYQLLDVKRDEQNRITDFETDLGYYVAQYDGCIRYLDDNLREIFEKLQQLGIYDETLIVVTSDHGEAFGENDIYFFHGLTVTRDQIYVPLIVKPHKGWALDHSIIDVPVSTVDIMPTILELCNHSYDDPDIDGRSLVKIIEGKSDPAIQERVLMSENERQYSLMYPNRTMELFKKEIPSSTYYPFIPGLIESQDYKKMYWDSGNEYLLSMPFDIYQRYKIVADIINKFRHDNQKFKILDVGAGLLETLKMFLPEDIIYSLDKDFPAEYTQKENFILGDILQIELKEKFDFVVAVDVYEHIPKPDRKKFLDIIIPLSEIATIIAAPFDQDDVRSYELLANEVYRKNYGSDYSWLKEHLENGLPSLPDTLDLIKNHNLDTITIPNGYLPRWFEMISTYLLTEGKPEYQPIMIMLYELYNKKYYQYDNRDPAYRHIIVIPKGDRAINFSDLAAIKIDPAELSDKNFLLESFIEKIKRSFQINDSTYKQEINIKNQQHAEKTTLVQTLKQATIANEAQLHQISSLTQALGDKEQQLQQTITQIESFKELTSIQKQEIEIQNKNYNNANIHAYGLQQLCSSHEIQITALTTQVEQVIHHAQGLEQLRSHQTAQIDALSSENVSLKSSVCYQCTSKFHYTIIGRFFPQNTRRRKYYDLGLKSIRILFSEGFGKLYWHYNERRRVKRIENDLLSNERKRVKRIENDLLKQEKERDAQLAIKKFSDSTVAQITFPKPQEKIDVSIIIPVHNQFQFTKNCLHSISKNTKGNYEVIIVDDASTDETVNQLIDIANLTIIENNDNLGFIESCNKGARTSNGKYILFLNNDTLVSDNWLTPLLDLIKKDDVGAVGSKLVYPDGKLQEAGAIIWNDASGWNYGRQDNPEKPEFNFIREVDYCSGAALLVKRELFEKIGGFDTRFKPAYYEDADLCFSIQKLGYKVLYQPKSMVIHFEGISNGTDLTEGVKQKQKINKEKFLHKWGTLLQESHLVSDSRNLFVARSRSSGKKILVIDQYVPFFDRDAGSYRMFNILKILSELGHKVSFIGDNFHPFEPYNTTMQQSGIEMIYSPFITSIEQYLSEVGENFDIVIISRPYIAQKHIADIRKYCIHAKVIYDTVDLAFLRESRMAEVKKDPQLLVRANETKNIELKLAKMSDITLVVSAKEQQILKDEDPSLNVQVISLIHKIIVPTKKFAERRDILFLGAFLHSPNADGAVWFINEIFPRIKIQEPDIRIFIVGDRPTEEILSKSSDDIIITGYVEDLSDYFNNCRVFVAPLRFGAGVKGKINQSMSRGLPVVTTSIGAEGMGVTDGENVLIADEPEEFSQKVIQLYNDEKLWNTLSNNSIEHIRQNTSYEQSKVHIKQFIDSL